jgi:hypothetical protein
MAKRFFKYIEGVDVHGKMIAWAVPIGRSRWWIWHCTWSRPWAYAWSMSYVMRELLQSCYDVRPGTRERPLPAMIARAIVAGVDAPTLSPRQRRSWLQSSRRFNIDVDTPSPELLPRFHASRFVVLDPMTRIQGVERRKWASPGRTADTVNEKRLTRWMRKQLTR